MRQKNLFREFILFTGQADDGSAIKEKYIWPLLFMLTSSQWFSIGTLLLPKRHLVISEDIFSCLKKLASNG